MAKAYDRIEWQFLNDTLLTMGFPPNLVATIMLCVSTVSFAVLANGQPSTTIHPHRGIRQGDPLSPYLFIICADVLSSLITKKQEEGPERKKLLSCWKF
ncbi:putative ribonuclease H protein [Trifolium medium]|uniref:Putative ribonuclease H protein n=1 Tax=Trifolium medium TaxID=97028 RepID=A0A392Q2Y8_9FABA|nr:putative ribonuclease H protein [Trifolium medium]